MRHLEFPLIDEVLRCERIPVRFFKFLQRQRADRKVVGPPVCKKIPVPFTAAPYPHKVIEQGCKPHDGRMGMLPAPVLHPHLHKFAHFRITGIDLHQMLFIPVVRYMVVHGYFFPDTVCKKTYRIGMERRDPCNRHGLRFPVIGPLS